MTHLTEIAGRHVKVEDVIFDGPVCRTCRDIGGDARPWPCDAALLVQRIEQLEGATQVLVKRYRTGRATYWLEPAIVALEEVLAADRQEG